VRALDRSRGAPERAREEAPQPVLGAVVGLLLCGGRSQRMGRDKALLELGGRTLIDYPLRALRAVSSQVLLACGPRARYSSLGLPLVLDPVEDGGPLAGLVAGLEAARERDAEWVAVLAVDLPWADEAALAALVAEVRAEDADACLLQLERGSQPTFAVYHVRCAPAARAALEAGQRRMVAFHGGRVEGRSLRVLVRTPAQLGVEERVGANVNTPDDLDRLRASVAAEGAR